MVEKLKLFGLWHVQAHPHYTPPTIIAAVVTNLQIQPLSYLHDDLNPHLVKLAKQDRPFGVCPHSALYSMGLVAYEMFLRHILFLTFP